MRSPVVAVVHFVTDLVSGVGGGRRGGGQQLQQQEAAGRAGGANRIRIRLGNGWGQGADVAPGPGGQMINLGAGDAVHLLDLTSQFANRGGPPPHPAAVAGGGSMQNRALVNLLFDVLQRSETTGGRHWVDGGRLWDVSAPPGRGGAMDVGSRFGGSQMGGRERAGGGGEHTAISDRK